MSNLQRQFRRTLRGALPTARDVVDKPIKLALARVAQAVLEGDCSNPTCPYRAEVLKTRLRNKTAVAKWRAKAKEQK